MHKELENFLRIAILIVNFVKASLISLVDLELRNKTWTFEQFINNYQHEIYHLCNNKRRCCKCQPGYIPPPRQILHPPQLTLLLDENTHLPGHIPTNYPTLCCSPAHLGISTDVLDITLARCLLVNFCKDTFWYSCTAFQGITLEQFLNQNKHTIYHLWQYQTPCCQCPPGFVYPSDRQVISTVEWSGLFTAVLIPCANDRKRPNAGPASICAVAATPNIVLHQINNRLQDILLKYCCPVKRGVECLVEMRNVNYGHVKEAHMSDNDYTICKTEIEKCIFDIARVCGNYSTVQSELADHLQRPLDETMCNHYQTMLLELVARNDDLREGLLELSRQIEEQTKALPNTIDSRIHAKIPKLIDKSKKITRIEKHLKTVIKTVEKSERSRLLEHTSQEINEHMLDKTFVETEALKKFLQSHINKDTFLITGRAGIGKSRNGLEIMRKIGEKYKDHELIKITNIQQVDKVLTAKKKTVLLLEDVFGKTNCKYNEDNDSHVLDKLKSYIDSGNVKVIFTIRSTVRMSLQYRCLFSSHRIFQGFWEIDLNSYQFQMTIRERETLLSNYCAKNNIKVVSQTESENLGDSAVIDKNVTLILSKLSFDAIVNTDTFVGFPQACYMFATNRVFTRLGVQFFKHPTHFLNHEIDNLRNLGDTNERERFKYVALVYILLNNNLLKKHELDFKAIDGILTSCYQSSACILESKVIDAANEMIGSYLKYDSDASIYELQHQTILESVLLSYYKVNPKQVLSLIGFDLIREIVRLQNYCGKQEEVILVVPKTLYSHLAERIYKIFHIKFNKTPREFIKWLCESELLRQYDRDFLSELYIRFDKLSDIDIVTYITYEGSSELVTFNILAALLWYMSIKNWATNDIKILLEYLISVVRSERRNKVIWSCHRTILASFEYTCKQPKSLETLCIMWKAIEDLDIKFDLNNTFQSTLESQNISACSWMLQNVPNKINIAQCVLDLDVNSLRKFVDVIASCFSLTPTQTYNKQEIIKWIFLSNRIEQFNITEAVTAISNKGWTSIVNSILDKYSGNLSSPLLLMSEACTNGWQNVVAWLLDHKGCGIFDLKSILIAACTFAWTDIADKLLKRVHLKDVDIEDSLNLACSKRHFQIIKILILNSNNYLDISLKLIVSKQLSKYNNHSEVTELCTSLIDYLLDDSSRIISNNIDLRKKEAEGLKVLKWLMENINEKYDFRTECIDRSLKCIKQMETFLQWIAKNVDLNVKNIALIMLESCRRSNRNMVAWLIENIDINFLNVDINLIEACAYRRFKIIKLLIKKVDNSILPVNKAVVALMKEEWKLHNKENFVIVVWLLQNIDSRFFNFNAIFVDALKSGLQDVIPIFLKIMKENVDKVNWIGNVSTVKWPLENVNNTLFYKNAVMDGSCDYGTLGTVKRLVEIVDNKLFDMKIVMNAAFELGAKDLVKSLVENIDNTLFDMKIVMQTACRCWAHDQVKWLVENVDNTLFDMKAVMNEACGNGELDTVKWLVGNVDKTLFDMKASMNEACGSGELDTVKWLVENVDNTLFDMEVVMHEAFGRGELNTMKWLVENVDYKLFDMKSVITTACGWGKPDLVKWLVENVDNTLFDMKAVMKEACGNGELDTVKWLVGNVDNTLFDMKTAMNEACGYGELDTVKWLVENVDNTLFDMKTAMNEACGYGEPNTVKWLVENVDNTLFDMKTAMNEACGRGDLDKVKWLVENVDHKLFDMKIVMTTACRWGKLDLVKWLVKNVDNTLFDMKTAMNEACGSGELDTVQWLVENVDNTLFDMKASMNEACGSDELDTVKWLVENVDYKQFDMKIVMTTACGWGKRDLMKWLVDNVDNTLFEMKTVMNEACDRGDLDEVKWLVENVDDELFDMKNVMTTACGWGKLDLVKWLVENVDNTLFDMKTVMNEACGYGELDTVKWLVENVDNTLFDMKASMNEACGSDELDTVKWLVENVDYKLFDMKVVMTTACGWGKRDLMKWLVDNVDNTLFEMKTVMNKACDRGDLDEVKWLVENVDYELFDMKNVMTTACGWGKPDLVKWLVENVDNTLFDMRTAMNKACDRSQLDTVKWLVENFDYKLFDMKNVMTTACGWGKPDLVKWLVENVDNTLFDMRTAMNKACDRSQLDTVKWLVENFDYKLFDMKIVMTTACGWGQLDLMKWLLENADNTLFEMKTIMNEACGRGDLDKVKWLVENVDYKLFDMKIVMTTACRWGKLDLVKWLVDNVDNALFDMKAAMNEARDLDIVEWLVENVDYKQFDMKIIMTTACRWGILDLVKCMVENVDNTLFDMNIAMCLACRYGKLDTVQWLVENVDNTLFDMKIIMTSACIRGELNLVKWLVENVDNSLLDIREALYKTIEVDDDYDDENYDNGDKDSEDDENYDIGDGDSDDDENYDNGDENSEDNKEINSSLVLFLVSKMNHGLLDFKQLMNYLIKARLSSSIKWLVENCNISIYDPETVLLQVIHSRKVLYHRDSIIKTCINKMNKDTINMKYITNELCRFNCFKIVKWLLDNNDDKNFDMRTIFNEACRHGKLSLVQNIWNHHTKECIDIQTATIKTCRGSKNVSTFIWLLETTNGEQLDMRSAMNNACRYGNTCVVKWMWANLDKHLLDMKTGLNNACKYEHLHTVRWLMSNIDHTFFNIEEAMIAACSQQSDIYMIEILSRYSDISKLDFNRIIANACKFGRTDIIEYMMERIDVSTINLRQTVSLILNMTFSSDTEINRREKDLKKFNLIWFIVARNKPTLFNMDEMFVEACKNGCIEIVEWCWSNSNRDGINVQSGINAACQQARHEIIDWALVNVDKNYLDLKTIMTESCGCGWLKIVKWIWNNIDHTLLDMKSSMDDACNFGRDEVILWLLNNTDTSVYDREIVWKSACQNGWKEIVDWLLKQFNKDVFNLRIGISEACANGKVQILDAIFTALGGDNFDLSELSKRICIDSSSSEVAIYLLTHFDHNKFDLSNIIKKACSSGWIEVVQFFLEHVSTNKIDLRAALNLACINGEYDVAELLIEKVAIEEFDMIMAMTLACGHGWDEIATLFLDKVDHGKLDIPQAFKEACRSKENDITELILRKVNHDLIDMKSLSNTAATDPCNESLIYWMLTNVDKRKLDLPVLEAKATDYEWRKVNALLKQLSVSI